MSERKDVDRYTQIFHRPARLFGRFCIWPMFDHETEMKVTRGISGDPEDVSCHFYAAWTYFTKMQSGGIYKWAFRGCSAYGTRAVRLLKRAYRNRRFEVDMELTPCDFIHTATNKQIQWYRVLSIDGPFVRASSVKEFWTESEIQEYRKQRRESGRAQEDQGNIAAAPHDPDGISDVADAWGADGGEEGAGDPEDSGDQ